MSEGKAYFFYTFLRLSHGGLITARSVREKNRLVLDISTKVQRIT